MCCTGHEGAGCKNSRHCLGRSIAAGENTLTLGQALFAVRAADCSRRSAGLLECAFLIFKALFRHPRLHRRLDARQVRKYTVNDCDLTRFLAEHRYSSQVRGCHECVTAAGPQKVNVAC